MIIDVFGLYLIFPKIAIIRSFHKKLKPK